MFVRLIIINALIKNKKSDNWSGEETQTLFYRRLFPRRFPSVTEILTRNQKNVSFQWKNKKSFSLHPNGQERMFLINRWKDIFSEVRN